MGDRLKDYGFMNPFRANVNSSNYGGGNAYLSGNGINQWLTDIATYNKILKDFKITSQDKNERDFAGANAALAAAGLQGEYTGPRGHRFITGAYLADPLSWPERGLQKSSYIRPSKETPPWDHLGFYVTLPNGNKYYTAPSGFGASISAFQNKTPDGKYYLPVVATEDIAQIATEAFKNITPNLQNLIYKPSKFSKTLQAAPTISEDIGKYINDKAAFYRSRDDGGGPLGVIAKGLGTVAQFAGMASGLNALATGIGSLAGGAGLTGAFNAAVNAAGAMPDIGSVIGGIAGSNTVGNLANIGVGGIIGGESGGVPGALLGAGGAAIGAGIDQAGGIREFIRDPLGNILGAVGLNGSLLSLSPAQLAAMGQAAQVGPGSLAQVTPPSSIGQNVLSTDYIGGIPHEVIEVVGDAGDIAQLGGGFGSSTGGAIGSALGGLLSGSGGSIGSPNLGGISGIGSSIGTPGNITGSIQTTAPGATPTAGTGTGQTGVIGGPGGISPDGMPIGTPGPYSDAYGQGTTESDFQTQKMFGMLPSLSLGMGGPWDYTGMPSGAGAGTGTGAVGTTGLLNTGTGGGGLSGTGIGGGDGLGGDGAGGGGLGGDGLGMGSGGFDYSGLLGGMTPGTMGDPVSFLTPRAYGTKKKGPASFYGKLQAPKKRKGITVRRA